MNKEVGIYVHIPFCESKCFYCDFCSTCIDKQDELIDKYIDAVCKEITNNSELLSERKIRTIYFGGGTPSYIDSKLIEKIITLLIFFAEDTQNLEITIELNPADCTVEKLTKYLKMGFNRFSVGLQSSNDNVLKAIGRRHDKEQFQTAYDNMVRLGINNISIDLITGLPNDTEDSFKNTINYILGLGDNIKHISMYGLEVHEGTKLYFLLSQGIISLPDENIERNMQYLANELFTKNGFCMYEISNYAKPGFESKHNLNYWKTGEYFGFGAAASSYINSTRYTNINNINEYINILNSGGSLIAEKEELDKLAMMKEFIILSLRLNDGLKVNEFKTRFNTNIFDLFKKEIDEHIASGLLVVKANEKGTVTNICLTNKGRDFANIVWQSFV